MALSPSVVIIKLFEMLYKKFKSDPFFKDIYFWRSWIAYLGCIITIFSIL